jgi:hypothetical protein
MTLTHWLALACGYVAVALYHYALLLQDVSPRQRKRARAVGMATLWPLVLAFVLAWATWDAVHGRRDVEVKP